MTIKQLINYCFLECAKSPRLWKYCGSPDVFVLMIFYQAGVFEKNAFAVVAFEAENGRQIWPYN
eukprot:m.240902 g.240902  ORF g.240902 m.240902 type:complete len:64 (+) comp40198_c0_seq28:1180-1371(+)